MIVDRRLEIQRAGGRPCYPNHQSSINDLQSTIINPPRKGRIRAHAPALVVQAPSPATVHRAPAPGGPQAGAPAKLCQPGAAGPLTVRVPGCALSLVLFIFDMNLALRAVQEELLR